VGLVLFSATFIFTMGAWQLWQMHGGPRRAQVSLYTSEGKHHSVNHDDVRRIYEANLSSIDFIDLDWYAVGTIVPFTDQKGKQYEVEALWKWTNPERFNYLGLRSAITGERIPILKPGDLIMTKNMLERTFGKGVNPIGFKVAGCPEYNGRKYETIVDVVDTGDWLLSDDHLYVVTDQMKEFTTSVEPFSNFYLDVILAKGKTRKDLQAELQKALPEYEVKAKTNYSIVLIRLFVLIFLMGSSILLIGLSGFLKTEIQLFRLRQREMGLRQCMGAQRGQLFGLLMWEVAIVFFFVTLLVILLSYCLADYALPIMQKQMPGFTVDMSRTYVIELWLCLATFILTAGIAALSVRRVIQAPLSEVVGKSHRVSTRGRSLLVVLMMVVCHGLLFVDSGVFFFSHAISAIRTPDNADDFRRSIVTEGSKWKPEFLDTLQHLKHIEGTTHVVSARFNSAEGGQDDIFLTDENLFRLLDIKLVPSHIEEEMDSRAMIHVRDYRNVKPGEEAKVIGYIDVGQLKALNSYYRPLCIYLCDASYFLEKRDIAERIWEDFERATKGYAVRHSIILKAKQGERKEAMKELSELYREQGRYTLSHAPIDNLFNVCFSLLRSTELSVQILLVLTVVAVLCIVLTLYSSVSLDTRRRQKEVAIRKAHGADTRQILWLFAKPYIWQLVVSSLISLLLVNVFAYIVEEISFKRDVVMPYLIAILVVALVTLLTVGYKIYKVSQLNPGTIIKKE
jgi:ABC-type antimicrobial peptide transport system permease subunit